ncbi:membrane protein implicated in regulation of membrane protease activity [Cerasibacillus quisquiliarum]|uniref:Putative membrane protein YuaF n=1 Tax=Cerasibacillus quisquiliarum TaxID=227865 RepID=A0A511UZS6_9BACI|nr:membrane protein implicated in regulation of membrane protease activity [Cerasibacillus quisquiliarum]GEN30612.1 putative membrane protein YuaF [Cerasibacillus quisquiliarum]
MTLFGYPVEHIYLWLLVINGILIILYLFFGDVIEAIDETTFIKPVLILAWIIFFSASGLIFEKLSFISSVFGMIISAIVAFLLTVLLNVFVFIPLANAEHSLSYTEESLIGRVGRIIISIPEDGFGEIFIESKSGMITKPATSIENIPISEGEEVLVLKIEKGVLYVVPYEYE